MAASSSSSSSSSLLSGSNPSKYDVFVSFRGEDTRYNFTSHLCAALRRSKIKIFLDNREVRKGDEISSSLLNAIRSSSLAIIIFSKHYASSSWCLNELLEILECKKTRGQLILPVFYHVSPSDIKKQIGSYGEALAKHEERFEKTNNQVRKWRDALTEVADLCGWDINQHDWLESEFVDKIVKDVLDRLNHLSSEEYLDHGLVGITSRIKNVESLLCLGMADIRIIGIWGMGGIGKTTIARALFNRIANQFDADCFLENVRDDAKNGQNYLQEKLLFKIFEKRNLNLNAFTLSRLRRMKILIVLDDVDDSEYLDLIGHRSLFGPGSRIIITSRDKQVLINGDVNKLYELKGLNNNEAFQLFSENAFKQSHPPKDYVELSSQVISYANGNPLALKVLGCSLLGRTKLEWRSSLDKLRKCSNLKIQNVLRISYDELDEQEQEIFHFIACFFQGEDKDRARVILDSCGLFTEVGLSVLVNKCLLTITENRLLMHNLIQEMGHCIVFQESKKPGERRILWDPQEICNLFKTNTGTSAVQGISLNLSHISELYFTGDVFTRMPDLKLLKLYTTCHKKMDSVQICDGLRSLPNELRYLCWYGYPCKSLPFNFHPRHLVELEMHNSNVEYLWKDSKFLGDLRRIVLVSCRQLIEIPDLTWAPNLQHLYLERCSSLTKFPKILSKLRNLYLSGLEIEEVPGPAIESLNKLVSMHFIGCTRLKNLPTSMCCLTSLKTLWLSGCPNFSEFPEISENITDLFLVGTAIEEVPHSKIESLKKLVCLHILDNTRLKTLPCMRHLTSLKNLNLGGCSNFTKFPEISGDQLEHLSLNGTAIQEVPISTIKSLNELVLLDVTDCTRLKNLTTSICHLTALKILYLGCSSKFPAVPKISLGKAHYFPMVEFRGLKLPHCKQRKMHG